MLIGDDRSDMRFQPTGTTLDKMKSSKDPRLSAWYWSLFSAPYFRDTGKMDRFKKNRGCPKSQAQVALPSFLQIIHIHQIWEDLDHSPTSNYSSKVC